MNAFTLWKNDLFEISTPQNPHVPYIEGAHVIVAPCQSIPNAWHDPKLAANTFGIAARTCAALEQLQFSPWFNIQANGNWGLLPGSRPFFHVHVYGRNKTAMWAKPIILPEAPKTYNNDPMPERDRITLSHTLARLLDK